jgi:hypothetical protein
MLPDYSWIGCVLLLGEGRQSKADRQYLQSSVWLEFLSPADIAFGEKL